MIVYNKFTSNKILTSFIMSKKKLLKKNWKEMSKINLFTFKVSLGHNAFYFYKTQKSSTSKYPKMI